MYEGEAAIPRFRGLIRRLRRLAVLLVFSPPQPTSCTSVWKVLWLSSGTALWKAGFFEGLQCEKRLHNMARHATGEVALRPCHGVCRPILHSTTAAVPHGLFSVLNVGKYGPLACLGLLRPML